MRKGKKEEPVRGTAVHIEKRECWCELVWVSGRYTGGTLLHRRTPDGPAVARLEDANQGVKT